MQTKPTVLLVDDNRAITENLTPFLERSGFRVATAADGVEGLRHADEAAPDIIVLDVMMPRLDGREVLRRLRQRNDWTPVILLTNVGEAYERAMALEEGADDYINKPFEPPELVARLRAVLRRVQRGATPPASDAQLICGPLQLDRHSRRASLDGGELALKPRSFALLEYLLLHPGEFFTRDQLLDAVWGTEAYTDRVVDRYISTLRRALCDDASDPRYIETVPGQGYRFIGHVRAGAGS